MRCRSCPSEVDFPLSPVGTSARLVQASFPRQLEMSWTCGGCAVAVADYLAFGEEERQRLEDELAAVKAELEGLRAALQTRAVIEQAKGIIAAAMHIDPEAAFEILVQQSQHTNV